VAAIPWKANAGERRDAGKSGAAGVAIVFQPFQQASDRLGTAVKTR